MEVRRGNARRRARGLGPGERVGEEVVGWRYDDDQRNMSRTQASRALSMKEAEYHAYIMGAADGLGMQSMMKDMGLISQIRVWTDSNAANAIASRRGLGKTRQFELNNCGYGNPTRVGIRGERQVSLSVNGRHGIVQGVEDGQQLGG